MFANITPPVALAAFAAAGISGGNPMKTGWAAVKLAIAGFIVPFMFVYSPQLLLIDTTFFEGLRVVIGACLGVFMIGVACEGYFLTKVHVLLRILSFGCALLLIHSGLYSDLIGFAGLIFLVIFQKVAASRTRSAMA